MNVLAFNTPIKDLSSEREILGTRKFSKDFDYLPSFRRSVSPMNRDFFNDKSVDDIKNTNTKTKIESPNEK